MPLLEKRLENDLLLIRKRRERPEHRTPKNVIENDAKK